MKTKTKMVSLIGLLLLVMMVAASGQAVVNIGGSGTASGQTATASIAITVQPGLTLALACPRTTMFNGLPTPDTQTCTATTNTPAPTGGATVGFTSSNPAKLAVQPTALIAANATSTTFTLTAP